MTADRPAPPEPSGAPDRRGAPVRTAAPRDRLAAARSPGVLGTVGLLGVTAAWGSTFFLVKDVVARIPAPDFLAVRFLLAAAVLGVVRPGSVAALSPALRRGAAWLGLVYGVAQILQTVGLQHTSASVSGFVTGMYVVFTPLLAALLLRQRVPPAVWGAVGLATVGLAVLSLRGLAVGYGEALTLASAALYAVHILGTGAVMTSAAPRDAYGVAVVQMAVISATCALGALPGGIALPVRGADWLAVVYMAVVAGALALLVQTWAQAHIPPTRTAIVMTTEPVWAGGFAMALGGETLGWRVVVGGALVLAAMIWCEISGEASPRPRRASPPTRGAPLRSAGRDNSA